MKEKIDLLEEKSKTDSIPILRISVTNLEINIEEGKVYKDSFIVESENGVPLRGYVHSTNDKIGLEFQEFEGTRIEIPYYFKGKLAVAGSEFEGDFVLLTDAGEFNIPYRFIVVPKTVDTTIGKISNMEEFTKLYHENRQEAMELFFLPKFAEVFLKDVPEQKIMYHSLMKSRSKNLIMEEFLSTAGYKEPVRLEVDKKQVVLDSGKDKDILVLRLNTDGYLEGRIQSKKGQVQISADRFTSNDFVDGVLEVSVEKNHNYAMGNDVILIKTVRQEFEISVEWWGTLPAYTKERELRNRIQRQRAELMHNYLYFRTGSIGFEDFAEESERALEDLLFLTKNEEWKLYKLHLLLMEEKLEEAKELFKELEEVNKEPGFQPLASNYLLYLKAMLYRTPETISNAVLSIREFYEVSEYKAEALWMLIYLDREYVYNKRLQFDTIKQLFGGGNNSCLLYFEACEILNENPNYMEELGPFEISVFRWGVRYGYISMSLAYQFARLALKLKYYSSSIYYIAEKLYKVEPDERFLQVICSLLIKGNRSGKEYHEYFRKAVSSDLKIIGLNEFFIRSMDFQEFEKIPQRVLIYFTYSNSLDSLEKAYLYCNVMKNKDSYDEVFGAYYSKMIPFVEEQLVKGKMNEYLAYLYTCFQKEILEKPANTKAVCDILFYQKVICHNKNMIGVYVMRPETGKEVYYPFSNGFCYAEILNERSVLYFVDSNEQRYVLGISYELHPFLSPKQFPEEWIQKNIANQRILLSLSDVIDGELKEKDLPLVKRIAWNENLQPWIKGQALEKMLVYYENHQNKKELARCLERTDYSDISSSFQKRLMDYYMEAGMIENAYFGIELYGCHIMGAAKRLKLAVFGVGHNQGKKDETTLYLAWSAFVSKKYNKDTLTYLMEFFEGEVEDLLVIWERSRKFELDTSKFERKILGQSMFTGNDTEGVFPVFESFYETNRDDEMIGKYLEYATMKEVKGAMKLSESMHAIIGEEIVSGKIISRESKIYFLYYFADRKNWFEKIRDVVITIIEELLKEELYLPVYYSYKDWLSLPIDYLERTFLTYRGGSGRDVILYYQVEGEEEFTKERHLQEILPGMYVCSMHFYQKDHVNYRLEADGELVKDESTLHFETFEYEGEDSRFFELNHLNSDQGTMEELKGYLKKAFFTDQFMKLI